ncbi:MAG: leucyl aminopeptidase [Pseudomonadota bacterium]
MSITLDVAFETLAAPQRGTAVIFATRQGGSDGTISWGKLAAKLNKACENQVNRASSIAQFKAGTDGVLDMIAPAGASGLDRLIAVGLGTSGSDVSSDHDWHLVGGRLWAELAKRKLTDVTVLLETADGPIDPAACAAIAAGMKLRAYTFQVHKTRKTKNGGDKDETEEPSEAAERTCTVRMLCDAPSEAQGHFAAARAVADGVCFARDLTNEPANILGPVEYAERLEGLTDLGVEVEILEPEALAELGMGALLSVTAGSTRPARVVVMKWYGASSKRTRPVCFIGKGVVFDTGGISLKPAKGMEDMKGDMGGSAAVAGVMHALAARQAGVNAIGIVGLVENMPGPDATRPGDIVTSMSGQTIEVINTDAEGRLVLCDLLWWAETEFKPRFMINLATLTGAIIVALGKEHAGLFSNDDRLAQRLHQAGEATGEKCWRMPMGQAYDKQLRSKFADMKNVGAGPAAGSITAAQFLARYVRDTPWAHLDVAGMAMASTSSAINESWGSGYGVRLLNALVAQHYETSKD